MISGIGQAGTNLRLSVDDHCHLFKFFLSLLISEAHCCVDAFLCSGIFTKIKLSQLPYFFGYKTEFFFPSKTIPKI